MANLCNSMKPIGHVSSLFTFKNGTPRQPSLCDTARGSITISKEIFNCPEHSLEGLEQYSHIWVMFIFHKNNNQYTKAKVRPPRLDGKRVGLFSTRSPYRPNPIGLTLAKLDRVEGATVHISGIDILDGSPVLDIKPFIPVYDQPITMAATGDSRLHRQYEFGMDSSGLSVADSSRHNCDTDCPCSPCISDVDTVMDSSDKCDVEGNDIDITGKFEGTTGDRTGNEFQDGVNDKPNCTIFSEKESEGIIDSKKLQSFHDSRLSSASGGLIYDRKLQSDNTVSANEIKQVKTADWLSRPPINRLQVRFTETAEKQMKSFSKISEDPDFKLKYLNSPEEIQKTICQILQEDPRSVYRRQNCCDSLYYFVVDTVHVTCWFDDDVTEVVRVKPASLVKHLQQSP